MDQALQIVEVPDRVLGRYGIGPFLRALDLLERRLLTGECKTVPSEIRFIPHTTESRRAWEERVRQKQAGTPEKRDRLYIRPWAKPVEPRPPQLSNPATMTYTEPNPTPAPQRPRTPAPAAPREIPASSSTGGADPLVAALEAMTIASAALETARSTIEQIRLRGAMVQNPRPRPETRMDAFWSAVHAVAARHPEFTNADVHAELARRGEARSSTNTALGTYQLEQQSEIVRVRRVGRHWVWRLNSAKG